MGLSLAICKRIVDCHDGKIDFESIINKGTTFSVTLPFKPKIQPADKRLMTKKDPLLHYNYAEPQIRWLIILNKDCPCPKKRCERHGKCEECTQHHAAKGKLSYCKRTKASIFGFLKKNSKDKK